MAYDQQPQRPQQPWPPTGQPPYGQGPPQYGQPGPGQYQPYQGQPYPPHGGQPLIPGGPRPQPPRKKRHLVRNIFAGIGALIVVIIVISVASSHSGGTPAASGASSPAASAASSPAARSSSPAARPVRARTVATFTGSGQQNTPRFTVTATWKLVYSFNCSNFGQQGNFAVLEDGGGDLNGVTVNDLATSKSASTWGYDDAGTHYLEIDSECAWKVSVLDEP